MHWSLIKCKKITYSILVAELYGMAYGFDIRVVNKMTLGKILGLAILPILFTNLKSFYDYLVKLATTQEKQLMVDVMSLRQSYKQQEMT